MKGLCAADKKRTKGHLPFYSVDTMEEGEALIEEAIRGGEFVRQPDGTLVEVTLAQFQSVASLSLAADRLAAIHWKMKAGVQ